MNDYEILLLLDPELEEDRQNEIVTRTRETLERGGGTWERHDVWGQRKLAYEIAHKGEGSYHLLQFQTEPEVLDEISRILRITDGVLRHLAVRRPKSAATPAKAAPTPTPSPHELPEQPEAGEEAAPEPAAEPTPEPEAVQDAG